MNILDDYFKGIFNDTKTTYAGLLTDNTPYMLVVEDISTLSLYLALEGGIINKYEVDIQKILLFTWKNNAYGEYAVDLNILKPRIYAGSYQRAYSTIDQFVENHDKDYIENIYFKLDKNSDEKLYVFNQVK